MDNDPSDFWTRRTFLERFGLVGGSAAVMAAMRSWDLMAQSVEARPQLTGGAGGKSVIVLGAGVSGLTAAYELGKLGYNVRILEARGRVGGVNWTVRRGATHTELGTGGETQTCTFDEGLYLNAGPWRIPHWHSGVLDYCKELNVPLQIFINEAEASYFFYEGADVGPLANKRVRLREVKADMVGYTSELLCKASSQDALDVRLTKEDKERLVGFLVTEGYLDNATYAYKGMEARGPGDPYNFSALLQSGFGSRVRSVMGGTGQAPMFQPIGGMDQFPKGFERVLKDKLQLNVAVKSIKQSPEKVTVTYKDTKSGAEKQTTADFVVSCIPLTVLTLLDVDLKPETLTAAKAVNYSPSAKMGLQMKRRFWEEDDRIFGGHLYSNLPFGEFSYPSNDFFSKKGIILGFYGNGHQANVIDMPIRDRVEHVLMHGSKVHPQLRPEFENAYSVFWEKIEYSRGAFASGGGGGGRGGGRGGPGGGGGNGGGRGGGRGGPGGPTPAGSPPAGNAKEALQKADGRIVLGCAAVGTDPSWQQGAVEAGWHAVKTLHARAMSA